MLINKGRQASGVICVPARLKQTDLIKDIGPKTAVGNIRRLFLLTIFLDVKCYQLFISKILLKNMYVDTY